jgi:hypothetical protein
MKIEPNQALKDFRNKYYPSLDLDDPQLFYLLLDELIRLKKEESDK